MEQQARRQRVVWCTFHGDALNHSNYCGPDRHRCTTYPKRHDEATEFILYIHFIFIRHTEYGAVDTRSKSLQLGRQPRAATILQSIVTKSLLALSPCFMFVWQLKWSRVPATPAYVMTRTLSVTSPLLNMNRPGILT